MRIKIQLSREETLAHNLELATDPSESIDQKAGDLAEEIWNDRILGKMECDGIDLEDFEGQYLYTIIGDPI